MEESILAAIDRNGGFIARNALIRQLAMPVGVCDNMIQVSLDQQMMMCRRLRRVVKLYEIMTAGMFSSISTHLLVYPRKLFQLEFSNKHCNSLSLLCQFQVQ